MNGFVQSGITRIGGNVKQTLNNYDKILYKAPVVVTQAYTSCINLEVGNLLILDVLKGTGDTPPAKTIRPKKFTFAEENGISLSVS